MGFMMDARPKRCLKNQWLSVLLLGILAAFFSVGVAAEEDERELSRQISLQGILGSKALLLVDGKRQIMSMKDVSKNGVRVVRITTEHVEVEVDGKRRQLRLGDSLSVTSPYKARKSVEVLIAKDNTGMYSTVGSINGLPVSFLVDTGASTIAMNAQQAARLGIDFRVVGEPTFVGTASGVSKAYRVMLDKVSVGGIAQNNIAAVVIDGSFPVQTLLGMTFLGKLEIRRDGNVMRLKKNY
jgi:aspartyl protease family protein